MKLFLAIIALWITILTSDHIRVGAMNTVGKAILLPSSNPHGLPDQDLQLGVVDKLVFTNWSELDEEGVYTSRVIYDKKPTFLKCMQRQDRY
jgi:hypothetical protein